MTEGDIRQGRRFSPFLSKAYLATSWVPSVAVACLHLRAVDKADTQTLHAAELRLAARIRRALETLAAGNDPT